VIVPLVGGKVWEATGNNEIGDGFGLGENNNSLGRHRVTVMFLFWDLKVYEFSLP